MELMFAVPIERNVPNKLNNNRHETNIVIKKKNDGSYAKMRCISRQISADYLPNENA